MTRIVRLRSLQVAVLAALLSAVPLRSVKAAPPSDNPEPTAAQLDFFEKEVRPLLTARCYSCHSAEAKSLKGDLRLDTRGGVLKGGSSGPAAVPGSPEESLLIEAVRYGDPALRMPPDRRLSDREVRALEDWVRMGLPDPRTAPAASASKTDANAKEWWAFQPLRKAEPPTVRDSSWPRSEIDRFVLAKLEANGMAPAPEADRRTLIRRLTFDLTGLPPDPEDVAGFLADDAPDALQRSAERLLASPRYGERWGRHWLDVVRYADTAGCNSDFPIPDAYRYRDYVIDSFNRDKPYDQFIREQIAGDLLPSASDSERFERIIATGYLAISRRFSSLGEEFHLTIDDTIDNMGKAFLGLTISCARCHDHKFDPIPQTDYYALYGTFESTLYAFPGTEIYRHAQDLTPLVARERLEELRPYLATMSSLDRDIFQAYKPVEFLDTGKEKERFRGLVKKLQERRDALLQKAPAYDKAYAVSEGVPDDARVQIKGEPEKLGPKVPRGFLQVLGGQRLTPHQQREGSGRGQLADWIADAKNPLTARVLVNRVWQRHFGRGLVRTPNDFGTRGEPPTHPELLDVLTAKFIQSGWSVKALHRWIIASASYRMASVENEAFSQRDPENKLLWSFNRRRLDAEEVRDAMLSVSGALDLSRSGPHPFLPERKWRYTQHNPFVDDYASRRRGVYLMQQRIRLQPFLAAFDGPDANASTEIRKPSATPQQALFLLNDELPHNLASAFADRLAAETQDPAKRIDRAYRLAFSRSPTETETREALDYLDQTDRLLRDVKDVKGDDRSKAAWASFLRVVLGSNEFVFVD